ncbi:MAG TPA: FAD-dependent oxidoreductase, partial [Gemmatimonadaceae bacterium]|nr:FAD-dependent oxidoreductase [Gemmatimonadaceae bacterium]
MQRSLRLAHAASRDERPAAELLAERRELITRRRFLATTAAAAGAAVALDGCVRLPRPATVGLEEPVLIIGAGIAGLTAAWRLRRAGVPVRVIEAQDRVGGRMFSLRGHFADGQVAELGGELIDTGHERIQAL